MRGWSTRTFYARYWYITLFSSKEGEQAINRDTQTKEQQREHRPLRFSRPFTLIHFPIPHYKKEHSYQHNSFTKKFNMHGAWKMRTRNIQTVRPVNCGGLSRTPDRRILKDSRSVFKKCWRYAKENHILSWLYIRSFCYRYIIPQVTLDKTPSSQFE